ncbi:hypothetical protein IEQ34_003188 [Dendrobium chrysotoxum]|uniref:Succinate dehydrogenase assembly factor 4, mitochondrial n=1 Tax=Dendrobium chrysotoxum TaxID=161865 RepID=A0AAV7HLE4_DENCH|nr:hypothetical protein IEQ34_003188 [Dendrobium chrysotoxum]
MANKLHRLLPPLLENRIGFPGTHTLSISLTKRDFSSTRRLDLQGEITDDLSSLPPNPSTAMDGRKLDDSPSQAEEEEKEEEEESGVYVNEKTGEISGPRGPEPTRYGDWERNGRCYDF